MEERTTKEIWDRRWKLIWYWFLGIMAVATAIVAITVDPIVIAYWPLAGFWLFALSGPPMAEHRCTCHRPDCPGPHTYPYHNSDPQAVPPRRRRAGRDFG